MAQYLSLRDWLWQLSTRRGVLMLAALCLACFIGFVPLISAFESVSGGAAPLDMQAGLSEASLRAQLAKYDDEMARRYGHFALLDILFPLVFSLFFCVFWATLLRHYWGASRVSSLCLLAFLSCGFDWAENLSQWLLVQQQLEGVTHSQALLGLALAAKHAKFAAVISNATVAILLAIAGRQLKRRQNAKS